MCWSDDERNFFFIYHTDMEKSSIQSRQESLDRDRMVELISMQIKFLAGLFGEFPFFKLSRTTSSKSGGVDAPWFGKVPPNKQGKKMILHFENIDFWTSFE